MKLTEIGPSLKGCNALQPRASSPDNNIRYNNNIVTQLFHNLAAVTSEAPPEVITSHPHLRQRHLHFRWCRTATFQLLRHSPEITRRRISTTYCRTFAEVFDTTTNSIWSNLQDRPSWLRSLSTPTIVQSITPCPQNFHSLKATRVRLRKHRGLSDQGCQTPLKPLKCCLAQLVRMLLKNN